LFFASEPCCENRLRALSFAATAGAPLWQVRLEQTFEKLAVIGDFEVQQFVHDNEFLEPVGLTKQF
jgi:hypothetical protein